MPQSDVAYTGLSASVKLPLLCSWLNRSVPQLLPYVPPCVVSWTAHYGML